MVCVQDCYRYLYLRMQQPFKLLASRFSLIIDCTQQCEVEHFVSQIVSWGAGGKWELGFLTPSGDATESFGVEIHFKILVV